MIVKSGIYSLLLALTHCSRDVFAIHPADAPDLLGEYCQARTSRKCCVGRQDDCSAPVLGTLCYCDDFCNRTRNEDCCPDFWTFCKNVPIPQIRPQTITRRRCEKNGHFYDEGQSVKFNCNVCKCESVNENQVELLCETQLCLVDEDLIERVNRNYRNYGWDAVKYPIFWGRYYEDGLKYRLGTIYSKKKAAQMLPINPIFDRSSLPSKFDARKNWPAKISQPQDQGWCGASWAFSTVAVASDRFAIALERFARESNNRLLYSLPKDKFSLSAQHLVNCNSRQRGCEGGHTTRAWNFVRKFGLVPESCYPWDNSTKRDCRVQKFTRLTEVPCPSRFLYSRGPQKSDLYRVGPVYRLSGEQDVMYEITESGPVQATMMIGRDFFSYRSGIYRCLSISQSERLAFHSVRIVGWGEEFQNNQVVKYWIVSNSWGEWWGEGGYFRIRRGVNECQIEEFILAAWANIESLNKETKEETQPLLEYDIPDITNQI